MTNARTIADSAGEATVLNVTAGTAAASKAVVLDGSKNIATLGTVASGALTVTGASTITTSDNTTQLTLKSTDADAAVGPVLTLHRESSSPADDDIIGRINFIGEDSGGTDTTYGRIETVIMQESNGSEDATMEFRIMKGGTERNILELDRSAVIINEDSQDLDFRVESNGNDHMFFVDGGNNRVGVGTSSPVVPLSVRASQEQLTLSEGDARGATFDYRSSTGNLNITTNGGNARTAPQFTLDLNGFVGIANDAPGDFHASARNLVIGNSSGNSGMTFRCGTADAGSIFFADGTSGSAEAEGFIQYAHGTDNLMKFGTSNTERMRIDNAGRLLIGKTSSGTSGAGAEFRTGASDFSVTGTSSGHTVAKFNRLSDDGDVVQISQANTTEGTISVSGGTVTYGGFTGSHWSRLADNSKPTILRGTIMDSIDEMCDWYQAVADVAEIKYTAEDQEVIDGNKNVGDVKTEAYTVKESIALGDKSVGDAITFTSDEIEHTGTIVKEEDVKHNKCKVSDTADSKKVYGVFSNWDDADDGLDGDVNDMNIAQVGTYIIRVNKDEVVQAGDLLVSNGDGTAKVQDDDIIRSKTVAKVNSTVKIETYADGSYTVPCTLHC